MTALISRRRRWLRKVREWATRYLPAELVGSSCAVLTAYLAYHLLHARPAAAVSAAVAESVGFYSVIVGIEWRRQRREAAGGDRTGRGQRPGVRGAWRVLRQVLTEFGPGELLDSLLVRPFAMYLGPLVTGDVASGTLVGKLSADALFYVMAITSYELTRYRARVARGGGRRYETVVLPRVTADGGGVGA